MPLDSEKSLSPCRRNLFAVVAIFVVILSVYSNTFDASWHYDDEPNIIKNRPLHLTELTWPRIKQTFFADWHESGRLYRPVACLSLALNYYIGRTEVSGYHLVNLGVHFLSSLFLFLFIYNTLTLPLLNARYGQSAYFIALLATVLWAISPVQTQAVTYVVQRMTSMAGMFYIMAMYFYLKARTSRVRSSRVIHYLICIVCGALAFGSKENSITLPVSILLFDLFMIQGLTKRAILRSSIIGLAVFLFCLSLALLLKGPTLFNPYKLAASFQNRGFTFTMFERLLTEPRVVLFYVSLLFYPMPYRLCLAHDISISKGLLEPPTTLIAILALLAILGLAISKSKRWPLVAYCILFFFINHAIESTILPLELVFEHRNYVPSMLFFVPIAILIERGITFFSLKKAMQFILSTAVVLLLVAWGHSTFVRNLAWKTDETLWMDAVDKSPNLPMPHHNLGRYYADIGLKQMALAQYTRALRLPEKTNRKARFITHYNMGLLYQSMGQPLEAERHFLKALEIEPRFSPAYAGLGVLYLEKGRDFKALQFFVKALTHDISSTQARNYIGLVLLRLGQVGQAVSQLQKVVESNPNDLYALTLLGIACKYNGDFDEAIGYFRKVQGINKRYVTADLHLIEVYFLKGEGGKAAQTADGLIALFPNERLSLLIDQRIIHSDVLMEAPNREIIIPILEKAIIKMGDQYYEQARKLKEYNKP